MFTTPFNPVSADVPPEIAIRLELEQVQRLGAIRI